MKSAVMQIVDCILGGVTSTSSRHLESLCISETSLFEINLVHPKQQCYSLHRTSAIGHNIILIVRPVDMPSTQRPHYVIAHFQHTFHGNAQFDHKYHLLLQHLWSLAHSGDFNIVNDDNGQWVDDSSRNIIATRKGGRSPFKHGPTFHDT